MVKMTAEHLVDDEDQDGEDGGDVMRMTLMTVCVCNYFTCNAEGGGIGDGDDVDDEGWRKRHDDGDEDDDDGEHAGDGEEWRRRWGQRGWFSWVLGKHEGVTAWHGHENLRPLQPCSEPVITAKSRPC